MISSEVLSCLTKVAVSPCKTVILLWETAEIKEELNVIHLNLCTGFQTHISLVKRLLRG